MDNVIKFVDSCPYATFGLFLILHALATSIGRIGNRYCRRARVAGR